MYKNRTQHSNKVNVYNACYAIHKDIEYVFII